MENELFPRTSLLFPRFYWIMLFLGIALCKPQIIWAQDFKNINLLDHWFSDTILVGQGVRFNEVWYFERNQRDYAILGSTEGCHFFEITADDKLRFVDFIGGDFQSPLVINRDFRDYEDHVYAVADQGSESALQIINISTLPDSVYLEKTDSTNWNRVHTLCIEKTKKLLYACTFNPPAGHPEWSYSPLKVFDLSDPLNPTEIFSGFQNIAEVHYAHARGDSVLLNCGFDGLRIYDFANPSSPIFRGSLTVYQDQGYNHSGWLSENGNRYFFTDETDGKRIKKVDLSDLQNPQITHIFGTENFANSTAHHCIPVGHLLFVSYYNEGLRIFDTRTPIQEIAHYDTFLGEDEFQQLGAWGVFPFRNGNRILISDRNSGLYLFGFNFDLFNRPKTDAQLITSPNPIANNSEILVQVNDNEVSNFRLQIINLEGKIIQNQFVENQNFSIVQTNFASGLYIVQVAFDNYLGERVLLHGKLLIQ